MKKIVVLLIALLSGCGGGLNCPFDTPSCCYNVLFGCGPFDLPSGCSCADYGLSYAGASSALHKTKGLTKKNLLKGNWSGILQRRTTSCDTMLKRLSGYISISEQPDRVTVTVPGYGKLRGLKNSRGFSASGSYKVLFSPCTMEIRSTFTRSGNGIGSLAVSTTFLCGGRVSCSATYAGTIQRWQ